MISHVLLAIGMAFGAQHTAADSVFGIGNCLPHTADSTVWEHVAESPDVQARLLPVRMPHPPLTFRDRDGNYGGRIVVAMVVDTNGRVVPGTLSIEESTDPRLSAWGCKAAVQLRFAPATVAGKPVMALTEWPFSLYLGEPAKAFNHP